MDKSLPEDLGEAAGNGAAQAAALQALSRSSGLRPWRLGNKTLLPVVQGGMGVGISAGGLAGAVAGLGGVGTISSVDLRRHHPDLMARTANVAKQPDARARVDAANLEALDREIARARKLSGGRGMLAVNIMRAVSEYEHYVRQALASGIDAIVVGAGLPLDLPELGRDYPQVALIPILSDLRGVQLVVRKWEKKGRLPDAIVIENPRLAGGHLGAAKVADLQDHRFDFEVVLPEVMAFLRTAGLEGRIPLVAAGGISSAGRHPPAAGPGRRGRATGHRLRRHAWNAMPIPNSSACWPRQRPRTWSSSPASPACRRAVCARPGWTSTCATKPG